MDRLRIATLNIRNMADRWPERLPLLLADMSALQPDLLGLQEVVYPMQQDRIMGAAGEGRYAAIRGWAGRLEYGNSLLVREPLVAGEVDRLDLGLKRAAVRANVQLPGGSPLVMVVTHLHHVVDGWAERDDQARQLVEWLEGTDPLAVRVVVGDFNAHPGEPAVARMRAAGYRSAYAEANGQEPSVTWPSGIQAEGMDTDGDPACLDYIWVWGDVGAVSAKLEFDRPHPDDATLYPSDHLGISADLDCATPGVRAGK